ncbi:Uncharacterised protein [Salmonella enterica subsp. enterica]|uniref:Uncharacterized protein n=1 Tax=Salmonella enterica I TaxID=59201 RepID=A0A3S4J3R1_SALET|nr:Uncharacterised protein [Salmonella enterica subsp. enterica]
MSRPGLCSWPRPARLILIASVSASIALSWPKTSISDDRPGSSAYRDRSARRSFQEFAQFAPLRTQYPATLTVFLRLLTGIRRARAPASSITSMALSGRWRSLIYFTASSTGRTHRFRGITHVVVRFVLRFQAVDNLHRLFYRRLGNINFLETAR